MIEGRTRRGEGDRLAPMHRRNQAGFTLMEILAVLLILGILIGVGVASLSGARKSGTEKACSTDLATLRAAAETSYAKSSPSAYGNEFQLRADGVLAQLSPYHDLTVGETSSAAASAANAEGSSQTGAAYAIKVQDAACGTVGQVVS
jgi:prepilin-type N-terminal cleavage/methylation domain-containing protein